jgi:cell division protein FtsB
VNEIAQWLGYGVMVCAAIGLLAIVLFVLSYSCIVIVNKWIKAMMRSYDLNTLRKTMRQLEAEGKVKRKEVTP